MGLFAKYLSRARPMFRTRSMRPSDRFAKGSRTGATAVRPVETPGYTAAGSGAPGGCRGTSDRYIYFTPMPYFRYSLSQGFGIGMKRILLSLKAANMNPGRRFGATSRTTMSATPFSGASVYSD